MAASKFQAFWNHPAGPRTSEFSLLNTIFCATKQEIIEPVHFWAPTFKWGLSIANVADFSKPPETLSYPMQIVVACSGLIWGRYGMVITPRNWNLIGVNLAMSGTGFYQLSRRIRYDYHSKTEETEITSQ